MAEMILPAVQLSEFAWGNVATALRKHDDQHLIACADEIDRQMGRLREAFGPPSGDVLFKVTATLRAGFEKAEG